MYSFESNSTTIYGILTKLRVVKKMFMFIEYVSKMLDTFKTNLQIQTELVKYINEELILNEVHPFQA